MSTPTSLLRTHGWRLALLASGLLMAAGGRMHPDAEATDSLSQELATMTADESWVPGHTLIMVSVLLLVAGLWAARSGRVWPGAHRAVTAAAIAFTAYAVETVFHLAAVADQPALAGGEIPPLTMAHLALSIVLYPVSGTALVLLGVYLISTERGVRRVVPVLAVLAGVLHAVSVPVTLVLPDAEATPLFAGAGMGLAVWSVLTALVGASGRRRVVADDEERSLARVG
jgi:hypothetical protein